jgi:hypothetical protein
MGGALVHTKAVNEVGQQYDRGHGQRDREHDKCAV